MSTLIKKIKYLKNLSESFVHKRLEKRRISLYLQSNRRPWGKGYQEYKKAYLRNVLNDETLLEGFQNAEPLSKGYGFRLDARVVEIPWALSHLRDRTGHILDAGSSLNYKFILTLPALTHKKITIVTLAPEGRAYWRIGVSYVFGDLRELDFRDACFDTIICISTIEHVGMDNSMYAGHMAVAKPSKTEDFLLAVQELKRVLKPGGALFVTLPFGQYENHGWLQQFDSRLMDRLIKEFDPTHYKETIFRYDPDGWILSDRASCAHLQLFDVHRSKYFDPNSSIDYPPDYPACERAVACLGLFN